MENTSSTESVPFVTQAVPPAPTHRPVLPAQPTHTSKESSASRIVELDNSPTTRLDHATHAHLLVPLASEPFSPHVTLAPLENSSTRTNVYPPAQATPTTTRMETVLDVHQSVENAATPLFV